MKLPPTIRELARIVGKREDKSGDKSSGDMTAGVERLFSCLPLFYRVKLFLETIADAGTLSASQQAQVKALLLDLEELEIERVYEEATAEGVLEN